jgi:hypothetical protein
MTDKIQAYRLTWPVARLRTSGARHSAFKIRHEKAVRFVIDEIGHLGGPHPIISTNIHCAMTGCLMRTTAGRMTGAPLCSSLAAASRCASPAISGTRSTTTSTPLATPSRPYTGSSDGAPTIRWSRPSPVRRPALAEGPTCPPRHHPPARRARKSTPHIARRPGARIPR